MNPKKRYKLAEDLKNFRTGEMVCKVKKSSQTDMRVDYYFCGSLLVHDFTY